MIDYCMKKKRGDAAWEYCVALFPVIVLTTTTENREQEVMFVITRISCPIQAGAIKMPLTTGTHSGYAG